MVVRATRYCLWRLVPGCAARGCHLRTRRLSIPPPPAAIAARSFRFLGARTAAAGTGTGAFVKNCSNN